MIIDYFTELFLQNFAHNPTQEQLLVVRELAGFVMNIGTGDGAGEADGVTGRRVGQMGSAFILRGYAGTGKTSLMAALVQTMVQLERRCVLLAPTGRAAKVFSVYAGHPAFTIHRWIYRQKSMEFDSVFTMDFNSLRHTLFIVDEASMVSNDGNGVYGTGHLLDDLIQFVYSGEGCRLILLGDTAQLPPVGNADSPALQPDVLRSYGLDVGCVTLTEVVRQRNMSGILVNATRIRELITQCVGMQRMSSDEVCVGDDDLVVSWSDDVRNVSGNELIDSLSYSYREFGMDDTIVVCRSNKRAHVYNMGIRSQILDREEELTRGDIVMIAKNNYFWLTAQKDRTEVELVATDDSAPSGSMQGSFLANGDIARVLRVTNERELYGFRFADCELLLPDYDDLEIRATVLLDTLHSEAPSLTREQSESLYNKVMEDYADIPYKRNRLKKLREDPYYNALQIKYAYAVTCHKAQGGQWSQVYVDQGYVTPEMKNVDYLRWLYTAFTRATDCVHLVNWKKEYD